MLPQKKYEIGLSIGDSYDDAKEQVEIVVAARVAAEKARVAAEKARVAAEKARVAAAIARDWVLIQQNKPDVLQPVVPAIPKSIHPISYVGMALWGVGICMRNEGRIEYFFTNIVPIGKVVPRPVKELAEAIPRDEATWVTAHTFTVGMGYIFMAAPMNDIDMQVALRTETLLEMGYYTVYVGSMSCYEGAVKSRLAKTVEHKEDLKNLTGVEYGGYLLKNCAKEVSWHTAPAMVEQALVYYFRGNLPMARINMLLHTIQGGMQCASTHEDIVNPDKSYSGKVMPFVFDAAVLAYTLKYNPIAGMEGLVGGLLNLYFVANAVITTHMATELSIKLSHNGYLEQVDKAIGVVVDGVGEAICGAIAPAMSLIGVDLCKAPVSEGQI